MKKENIFVFIILGIILGVFFYKFFFLGLIPFPGDLLIHDYAPWKYESYLGYNPGSYPSKLQYFDVLRQLYPWKIFVIEQLKSGHLPLWNPYNFAGTPLLANLQSQVFAPFNILYFILPYTYGWSIALILQTVLSFIFTYLYARYMKLSQVGSIFASVAYACSLYMSVFFEYGVFGQTILWLPFVLLGIEMLLKKFSLAGLLTFVAALTFAAFGGHLQIFSSLLIFCFFYACVRLLTVKDFRLRKAGGLIFAVGISIGIAAIQFLPTIELIGLSARAPHDPAFFFQNLLLQFQELIVFISPDFYGNPATNNYLLSKSYPQTAVYIGIFPLIFALSSLFFKKENVQWFFIGAIAFLLVTITNNPLSTIVYSLHIPFISSSAPTNMIFLISFSLSILAGYALDLWIIKKNRFPLFVTLFLGVILALVFCFYQITNVAFSSKNAVYSFIVLSVGIVSLLLSAFIKNKKIFAYVFIIITIFDLFYFFQKFNPFVPQQLVFPQTSITKNIQKKTDIERVWGYGAANILANTNILSGFSSPEGYDPLYPKRYGEFVYLSQNGKLLTSFTMNTRSNAMIDSSLGFVPEHKKAQKVLDMTGVRYVIDRVENGSSEKTFPDDTYKVVYDQNGWKIFHNNKATPRAFLTTDYKLFSSSDEFEKIFSLETFDPSVTLLLEKSPSFTSITNMSAEDSVKIEKYQPNNVSLTVSSKEKKLLFLSDMYYPGWKASVDEKEVEILRANYTFRAIEVPSGKHNVQFVYKPQSFFVGSIVTLVSIIILFVVACILYVRKLRYE